MGIVDGAIRGGIKGSIKGFVKGCLEGENELDILAYAINGAKNGVKKGATKGALEEGINLIENGKISNLISNIPEKLISKKGYPVCLSINRCPFENNHSAQDSCCKAHEENCPLGRLFQRNDGGVDVCFGTKNGLVIMPY